MKRCPTCDRTYPDDTLAFCLIDGSVLSAPYDPQEPRRGPARGGGNSTRTQVLNPTVPNEPAPAIQPTIRAPLPQVPPLKAGALPLPDSDERKSRAPWIIAGVAVFLAAVFGIVLLVSLLGRSEGVNKQPDNQRSDGGKDRPQMACTQPLSPPIYDKWIEHGGENGRLKCPVESEGDAPASPQGTSGRWVRFAAGDGGYIVWHKSGPNAGKAFEVSGCMFKIYFSLGGTKSWLGFPVTDERETSTGARQDFEAGYILWYSKTYACQAHRNP